MSIDNKTSGKSASGIVGGLVPLVLTQLQTQCRGQGQSRQRQRDRHFMSQRAPLPPYHVRRRAAHHVDCYSSA